jgi:hypothetical protein
MLLRDDRLAFERRDSLVDFDAARPRAHESGVVLVPDVTNVEEGVAGGAEAGQKAPGRARGRLWPLEGVGTPHKVVVLNVDDYEGARHGGK